jgi:hypothetical protein
LWLALTAVFVLLVNRMPQGLIAVVTMTVDAETEVLAFDVESGERMELPLPAGQYALFSGETSGPCSARSAFDIVCPFSTTSTLAITGPARVALSLLKAGEPDNESELPRIVAQILPLSDSSHAAQFSLTQTSRQSIATSTDAIDYESDPVSLWRTELNLTNVTLGALLPESTIAEPILTAGSVRFFARIGGAAAGRFLVKTEALDPEDIVRLDTDRDCPVTWGDLITLRVLFGRTCSLGLVGPITLEGVDGGIPDTFAITLHTNRSTMPILRSRGGHIIRVSNWEIVSEQPALLAVWAAFISLMLIVTYMEGHDASHLVHSVAEQRDHEHENTPRRPPRGGVRHHGED